MKTIPFLALLLLTAVEKNAIAMKLDDVFLAEDGIQVAELSGYEGDDVEGACVIGEQGLGGVLRARSIEECFTQANAYGGGYGRWCPGNDTCTDLGGG